MSTAPRSCRHVRSQSTAPGSGPRKRAAQRARTRARNRTWRRRYRTDSCCAPARIGSASGHLGRNWSRLLATDQPPDAGKIHDPDPEPVEEAVIRDTRVTRTIDDVDIGDVISLPAYQSRQEPMQAIEIRHHQDNFSAEGLEAAAGVAGAIVEDRIAN